MVAKTRRKCAFHSSLRDICQLGVRFFVNHRSMKGVRMTTLNRVVLSWTGNAVVGNSVTVLHYSASDNPVPPVAAIKTAMGLYPLLFPSGLTVTVPNSGDQIDDTTGNLTGVWTTSGGGSVAMANGGGFAAGAGACIGWTTGGIVPGTKGPRKLRGRMFLVPLAGAVYGTDGTILDTELPKLQSIADGIRTAGPLAVWHRPSSPTATDGNSYGVLSARVRDKVAFLSSRRD